MKAYRLYGIGDLRYEEADIPYIPEGWCLVKVEAVGICSSDIPRIYKNGTYHFPTIPGHEFSGIVEKVNRNEDAGWLNKHVGVFPLIPCMHCEFCEKEQYEMCEHYDYIGSRRDGAFAEYVAVPVWNLIELNPGMPVKYAAMLEPLSVARHALRIAGLEQGQNVAVVGTGTIGFAAAAWACCMGAEKVTIIGRNDAKRKNAENMGSIQYCNSQKDAVESADLIIEAVGSEQAVELAVGSAKPGGTIVLLGNPYGNISLQRDIYWRILRKQLKIFGSWNSTFKNKKYSDWKESVQAIDSKLINCEALITHEFSFDHLMEGLKLMRNHITPYCKVMIEM